MYIALPNHLHQMWTIRPGKHVLCGKPLATNASECDEMIDACRQVNVLLMEAVMYRFYPRVIHFKQMITGGELGKRYSLIYSAALSPLNTR